MQEEMYKVKAEESAGREADQEDKAQEFFEDLVGGDDPIVEHKPAPKPEPDNPDLSDGEIEYLLNGHEDSARPPAEPAQDRSGAGGAGSEHKSYSHSVDLSGSKDVSPNLIINYMPSSMTEKDLEQLFAPYGRMTKVKVIRNFETGESSGYGFVTYETVEAAAKAIEGVNGHFVDKKRLKVSFSKPSTKNTGNRITNLYISGLPVFYKADNLRELFREFEPVHDSRILLDLRTGESKGVGFVRLDSTDIALKAIRALNNTIPTGGSSRIVVKFADVVKKSKFGPSGGRGQPHDRKGQRYSPMDDRKLHPQMPMMPMMPGTFPATGMIPQTGYPYGYPTSYVPFPAGAVPPPPPPPPGLSSSGSSSAPTSSPSTFVPPPPPPPPASSSSSMTVPSSVSATSVGSTPAHGLYAVPSSSGVSSVSAPAHLYTPSSDSSLSVDPRAYALNGSSSHANYSAQLGLANPAMYQSAAGYPYGAAAGYYQMMPTGYSPYQAAPAPPSQGGSDGPTPFCLFVFHLPIEVTEEQLRLLFSPYCNVVGAKIAKDPNHKPKGYGFVNVGSYEEGETAMRSLNGVTIGGKRLKISWKTSKSGN